MAKITVGVDRNLFLNVHHCIGGLGRIFETTRTAMPGEAHQKYNS
jgi:hypothetical protein